MGGTALSRATHKPLNFNYLRKSYFVNELYWGTTEGV